MQQSKVHDKVGIERNEPQMVKPLRIYNPCDQVVIEINGLTVSATSAHIQKVNLVYPNMKLRILKTNIS